MRAFHLRSAAILLAAGIGLGGCAASPFGYGSGVSVGYGNSGYYDPYYSGYGSRYGYGSPYGYGYSPYGYGYSPYGYSRYGGYSPYWGWNNGYYYPGTGYYVYDRDRRPRVMTDAERQYWTERANSPGTTTTRRLLDNWSGFSTGGQTSSQTPQSTRVVGDSQPTLRDRRAERRALRVERSSRPMAEREQSTRIERRIERARESGRIRVVGGEGPAPQPE